MTLKKAFIYTISVFSVICLYLTLCFIKVNSRWYHNKNHSIFQMDQQQIFVQMVLKAWNTGEQHHSIFRRPG